MFIIIWTFLLFPIFKEREKREFLFKSTQVNGVWVVYGCVGRGREGCIFMKNKGGLPMELVT